MEAARRSTMSENDEHVVKTQTLLTEEIEKLLQNAFGGKLQPINNEQLKKQRRMKAGLNADKKEAVKNDE